MKNPGKIDLTAIDLSSLTPSQWEALKAGIVRQAKRERAEAIRSGVSWILNSLGHAIAHAWAAIHGPGHHATPSRGTR